MKTRVGTWAAAALFLLFYCGPIFSLAAGEKRSVTKQNPEKQNPFDISLTSGNGPVHISSGTLELFYHEQRIVFRGEVVATRDNGTIRSDLLTVTYDEQDSANNTSANTNDTSPNRRQRIKEAIAEGNVVITSDSRRATCKKAIFNEVERTVVLSGDAVLHDGDNEVKGQTVTVYLDEGRTKVEGTPGVPSEVRFTPKQEDKQKKEGAVR